MSYIYSYEGIKDIMLTKIKTDRDSVKYSSKCHTYKMSKEEMEKYLSKYNK